LWNVKHWCALIPRAVLKRSLRIGRDAASAHPRKDIAMSSKSGPPRPRPEFPVRPKNDITEGKMKKGGVNDMPTTPPPPPPVGQGGARISLAHQKIKLKPGECRIDIKRLVINFKSESPREKAVADTFRAFWKALDERDKETGPSAEIVTQSIDARPMRELN